MEGIGGYLWLVITVGCVAALAGAMLWGTHRWRQKRHDRAAREAERHAVERVYREDEKAR